MKLTIHILALLTVFSAFSLIGCSDNNSTNPQVAAQKCLSTIGCPQSVLSAVGATQGQIALATQAIGATGTANGAPAVLPPAATGTTTTLTGNTSAPAVLPVSSASIASAAAKIQKAMNEASANPMSSYYVDANAPDIPARNSQETIQTVQAIKAAIRQPAAADNSGGSSVTQ